MEGNGYGMKGKEITRKRKRKEKDRKRKRIGK